MKNRPPGGCAPAPSDLPPEDPARAEGPAIRFVPHLPDLITPADYEDPPERRRLRVRISATDNGVEILGDSMYAAEVEALLASLGAAEIERMLCG